MQNSQPSFYAIIPAHIRYNKELEMGAKLLYGEITALCSQEGYCWATNDYFAGLYDVDVSTIKRWISSLKNQKFIVIELDKANFACQRKIWISPEIQKVFTVAQKRAEGSSKMSRGWLKNEPHINTYSNTKKREGEDPPKPPAPEFVYKRVKMDQDKHDALAKELGPQRLIEMMDRLDEYADINPKRFKQYACHAAVIRKWHREDDRNRPAIKGNANEVKKWLQEKVKSLKEADKRKLDQQLEDEQILIANDNIRFISYGQGGTKDILIKFSEENATTRICFEMGRRGIAFGSE